MTHPSRFLRHTNSTATQPPGNDGEAVDSDFVVILAALLCALICVLGLIAVARCAWLRRLSGGAASLSHCSANKGLKKKVLRSLPKLTYSPDLHAGRLADCAICLTEFAAGDEIRVLPQCGHGFHVSCIDAWLGSHSSCPSCRQILVVARCQKCGGLPPEISGTASDGAQAEIEARIRVRDGGVNSFLP
ncbi:RING-H2 finger protein atl80 [Ancistrocladus abbreviatus]